MTKKMALWEIWGRWKIAKKTIGTHSITYNVGDKVEFCGIVVVLEKEEGHLSCALKSSILLVTSIALPQLSDATDVRCGSINKKWDIHLGYLVAERLFGRNKNYDTSAFSFRTNFDLYRMAVILAPTRMEAKYWLRPQFFKATVRSNGWGPVFVALVVAIQVLA